MADDRRVQQQYFKAFGLGRLNVTMLRFFIRCVKNDQFVVLIRLVALDFLLQFLKSEVFAVYGWIECKFVSSFKEFILGKHSVFDDDFDVVPFLLEILPIVLEEGI